MSASSALAAIDQLVRGSEHWWLLAILLYSAWKERRNVHLAEREVEMAEKEFAYDEEWNKKMLAREARRDAKREASKKDKYNPFDLGEMD